MLWVSNQSLDKNLSFKKEITGIVYHNQLVDETKFSLLLDFRFAPVIMKLIQYIFLNILNANLKSVYPFFVSTWRYIDLKVVKTAFK